MNLFTWISFHTAVISAGATVVSAVATLVIAFAALAGVRIARRHRDVAEQTFWDSQFREYEKIIRERPDFQDKMPRIYKLIDLADKHPKIYYERVAGLFSELLRKDKLHDDDIKEKIMMWFSSRKREQRKIEKKLAKENRPAMNIRNADLSGLRLPSIDLSGMDMLGVKLANSDLSNANLRGTKNLTKEQLDEAVWDPDKPPITDFSDNSPIHD